MHRHVHVWKCICGSIVITLKSQQKDRLGGREPCSSYILPMKWTGAHRRVSLLQKLSREKFILWCHGELHQHSLSMLPPPPPIPHMCVHIYIPLLPSIHPLSCNYAPWLFVSMFFQKLPGETRVEKPIACSQQIKEACAFLVTSCRIRWGVWSSEMNKSRRWGSFYFHLTLVIAQQVSAQCEKRQWCI